jgi:hypothetical protein
MMREEGAIRPRALVESIADRFARALTEPRLDLLDELLTEDFLIWYNFSNDSLTRGEAIAFFRSYFSVVAVRFRATRITPSAQGFVQQHLVDADGPDGFIIRGMPALLVVTTHGERIRRIDEYMDSAAAGGFDASQMKSSSHVASGPQSA